jgi:hypothetical protein
MTEAGLVVLVAILAVLVIVFAPLVTIWALNTLFALAIPYTFKTWLATTLLTMVLTARNVKVNK